VPAFLLDNNHVHPLYQKRSGVEQKLKSFKSAPIIRVCTITLGEIEAGHQRNVSTNPSRRDEFVAWLNAVMVPYALPVSSATGRYYADIIGRIWKKHPPSSPGTKTEPHLVSLGIDINDVWTAAVAFEHGMTLVTQDRMECIRDVMLSELPFDCWI
jgi:predicted nucleic acid-binding protein